MVHGLVAGGVCGEFMALRVDQCGGIGNAQRSQMGTYEARYEKAAVR